VATTVTARRVLVLAAIAALVGMVALGMIWMDRMGRDKADVQIFERPTSFCDEFRSKVFASQAAGVAATSGKLRLTVAGVEAGLLDQMSRMSDTPPEVRRDLLQLADEIQDGASTGDFDAARATAASVDAVAERRCG
jgi:hypothetical protein